MIHGYYCHDKSDVKRGALVWESSAANSPPVRLHLLGTAGGALTYRRPNKAPRNGPSFALEVGEDVYLVDVGQGAARQFTLSRPIEEEPSVAFQRLRGIFLTHLHSDHVMDLNNVLLCATNQGWPDVPVDVWGPGPGDTVGTERFVEMVVTAYRVDERSRAAEEARMGQVTAHDIEVPAKGAVAVYDDENVTVTAAVADHGATHPCFAYRFDTAAGSVVFSGDTSPAASIVALARDADVLVHEAVHPRIAEWLGRERDESRIETVMAKHTPIDRLSSLAAEAGVGLLVVAPLAPGDLPDADWRTALGDYDGRVVVGDDLMCIAPSAVPHHWKVSR